MAYFAMVSTKDFTLSANDFVCELFIMCFSVQTESAVGQALSAELDFSRMQSG